MDDAIGVDWQRFDLAQFCPVLAAALSSEPVCSKTAWLQWARLDSNQRIMSQQVRSLVAPW
jgi:hypothetical protein